MPLKPTFKIYHQKKNTELFIEDTTDLFHAINNPFGYDPGTFISGNPRVSDVKKATALIKPANGVTYTVDIYSASIPFPNFTGKPFKLLASAIGLQTFPEGEMSVEIIYEGEFGTTDPLQTFVARGAAKLFYIATSACCVTTLWNEVESTEDPCENSSWSAAKTADIYLKGILHAVGNPFYNINGCSPRKISRAEFLLARLQEICSTGKVDCKPCQ